MYSFATGLPYHVMILMATWQRPPFPVSVGHGVVLATCSHLFHRPFVLDVKGVFDCPDTTQPSLGMQKTSDWLPVRVVGHASHEPSCFVKIQSCCNPSSAGMLQSNVVMFSGWKSSHVLWCSSLGEAQGDNVNRNQCSLIRGFLTVSTKSSAILLMSKAFIISVRARAHTHTHPSIVWFDFTRLSPLQNLPLTRLRQQQGVKGLAAPGFTEELASLSLPASHMLIPNLWADFTGNKPCHSAKLSKLHFACWSTYYSIRVFYSEY
jgi:hypothetical protein